MDCLIDHVWRFLPDSFPFQQPRSNFARVASIDGTETGKIGA
jgi:hypothetical protein